MNSKVVRAADVQKHFDELSEHYDEVKEKNRYYYESLKSVVAGIIPEGKRILDIGTGTGEILNVLRPSRGIGIDLSPKMIEKAKGKFRHLDFFAADYESFETDERFDYILMTDLIEHVERPDRLFLRIQRFCSADTRVVLTMANPLWEPLLHLLEVMHLKMDEGPHHRISENQVFHHARSQGFELSFSDCFLLLPLRIFFLSRLVNHGIGRIPVIKRLALIKLYVFDRKPDGRERGLKRRSVSPQHGY